MRVLSFDSYAPAARVMETAPSTDPEAAAWRLGSSDQIITRARSDMVMVCDSRDPDDLA